MTEYDKSARILIVDDDHGFQRALKRRLEGFGYRVDTADSCKLAMGRVNEVSYALGLVDLVMEDFRGNVSKNAGIELCQEINSFYPEIPIIIVTSYPDYKTARMKGTYGIVDYLTKESKELDSLAEKISSNIKRNQSLRIEEPKGQIELHEDEIEILQKLFLKSIEVRIDEFGRRPRGVRLYKVDSYESPGIWIVPLMVKFAWRDAIIQEFTRFNRYVKHKIPESRYPEIVGTAFAGRRGGMACSFVGNFEASHTFSFAEYYHKHSPDEIEKVVGRIFTDLFKIWHENKGNKQPVNLFDEYEDLLFETQKIKSATNRNFKGIGDQPTISAPFLAKEFSNPVLRFQALPKKYDVRTYICTVHGDLNGGNILIDQSENLWLIDFERTAFGHVVRDHAELEVSVKYDVLQEITPHELAMIEKEALMVPNLSASLLGEGTTEKVQKALRAIEAIRKQAEIALAPTGYLKEYFISLLYHTLNLLRFENRVYSKDKKMVMLYAAHLLLERIEGDL